MGLVVQVPARALKGGLTIQVSSPHVCEKRLPAQQKVPSVIAGLTRVSNIPWASVEPSLSFQLEPV